ncbi:hypothetical protein PZA11_003171 [Diplocarpon coronariae]|nr:hypothetical protein JHW43_006964 [Diplocarpon mali]
MLPRKSKKNHADARSKKRINVTINLDSDCESDYNPAHTSAPASKVIRIPKPKKKKHDKSKQPTLPKPTVSDEVTGFDENEQAIGDQTVQKGNLKKPSALDVRKEKEVLLALQNTAAILTSLGSKAEVERILKLSGSRNNETLQGYRDTFATFFSPASLTHGSPGEVPSTIHLYDKYFAYQGPCKQLYIMRPVDVIQGNVKLTRKKVAGFIKDKSSNFPLKYALPGWVTCHEYHPKVLDSGFWTEEVQRWGEFHNHNFPSHPYEMTHLKPKGHASASHVEIRLMLWYACERLKELQKVEKPIRALLGELWRLRDYNQKAEAEIFLTRPPCEPCLEIIKLIEEYTRITFHIRHMPNLGELQPIKKNGWVTFDRYAPNPEDEEKEEPIQVVEEEIVQKSKRSSTMEVIIQSKPAPLLSTSFQQIHEREISTITKTSTKAPKSMLISSSSQNRPDLSESEESDYQPQSSKPKKLKPVKARKRPSIQQYGLPMPDDSPFSAQARKQAELLRGEKKMKKKRARESEVSSMCSKKSRHTKFH